jgi:protein TonB
VFTVQGKLLFPNSIPKQVAMISEGPLPPEFGNDGVPGGVYGGMPGGSVEEALEGMLGGISPAPPPPPPVALVEKAKPKDPLRVGGNVRPPRALYQPHPVYPWIAKQARIEGDVVISSTIDTEGNVIDMQAVSGPPLLYAAAFEALAKWKFEPTHLDNEPVAVILNVTIHFRL